MWILIKKTLGILLSKLWYLLKKVVKLWVLLKLRQSAWLVVAVLVLVILLLLARG